MEEPSNSWPTVKNSSSTEWAGMLKCCCTPGKSVKRMSRNLTSFSLMYFSTSEEFLNMQSLLYFVGLSVVGVPTCLESNSEQFLRHIRIVSSVLHQPGNLHWRGGGRGVLAR